jgi:DNA polymerase-3 subunit beta
VLLRVGPDGLRLKVRNGSSTLISRIRDVRIESRETVRVGVPLRLLVAAVRRLQGEIRLRVSSTELEVSDSLGNYTLRGSDPERSPNSPKRGARFLMSLPGTVLAGMLDSVVGAAARRGILSVLQIEARDGRVRVVATDGHRLHIAETGNPSDSTTPCFDPVQAAREMVRMCSRWVNLVQLSESNNSIFLEAGDRVLIVENVASPYPGFEAEVPPDVECPVIFPDVDVLVRIVREAGVIGEGKPTAMTIVGSRGRISFASSHENLGAFSRSYDSADAIGGAPVSVSRVASTFLQPWDRSRNSGQRRWFAISRGA